MGRWFNTAGPCLPAFHYMIPASLRLPEAPGLVEQLGYFVVHAPRQTGKTTASRLTHPTRRTPPGVSRAQDASYRAVTTCAELRRTTPAKTWPPAGSTVGTKIGLCFLGI